MKLQKKENQNIKKALNEKLGRDNLKTIIGEEHARWGSNKVAQN